MAERPNQNWQGRNFLSLGPKFRIDTNNPQMGSNGTNVYCIYGATNTNDICLTGLTEAGTYRIFNDRCIEFIAGNKESSDGVDIVIAGMNGDITVTAMRNGSVRIKGKNIMIDADEDVDIKAGRNVSINAGSGRILLKANKADVDALTGNLVKKTFGMDVFSGSFVGGDIVTTAFDIAKTTVTGI
jgi:hypothetical protein